MMRLYIYILGFLVLFTSCGDRNGVFDKIEERYRELEVGRADCATPYIKADDPVIPKGKKLMQIMIVRHGKPKLKVRKWYSWREAEVYINAYDTVGVEQFLKNPVCLSSDIEQVYCSVLQRSKSTAQYMCEGEYLIVEDLRFREFEREILQIPYIKMPLFFWLATARISWFFGWGKVESYGEAKERSKEVAVFLADEAKKKGKVLLVAHGFLNRFVFDDLEDAGWYQARDGGHDYLAVSVFVKLVDKKEK